VVDFTSYYCTCTHTIFPLSANCLCPQNCRPGCKASVAPSPPPLNGGAGCNAETTASLPLPPVADDLDHPTCEVPRIHTLHNSALYDRSFSAAEDASRDRGAWWRLLSKRLIDVFIKTMTNIYFEGRVVFCLYSIIPVFPLLFFRFLK